MNNLDPVKHQSGHMVAQRHVTHMQTHMQNMLIIAGFVVPERSQNTRTMHFDAFRLKY